MSIRILPAEDDERVLERLAAVIENEPDVELVGQVDSEMTASSSSPHNAQPTTPSSGDE